MTGLTASTTYYVRAYATNSVGTAYGEQVSFTTLAAGITGDVNGDNRFNLSDISLILSHIMGDIQLTGQAFTNADVNGDNRVNLSDVSVLLVILMNQ